MIPTGLAHPRCFSRTRSLLRVVLATTVLASAACDEPSAPVDDRIPWDRIPGRLAILHYPDDAAPNFHISILDGGAREVVEVTDSGGISLSWSPDGRWLAFQRRTRTDPEFHRTRIYTVEARRGAVPELVLPAELSAAQRTDPSWGPDGRIAFLHLGYERRQVWLDEAVLVSELDAEAGSRLAWSPDGAHLVVAMRTGGVSLYRITVATGEAEPLLLSGSNEDLLLEPRYSPDGQRIFFTRVVVGSPPVTWVVRADGSEAGPAGAGPVGVWSPDGSQIAFVEDGRAHLVSADGADTVTLPMKEVLQVEWAP